MLKLAESFLSIQGESTHAGRRCFFIRLSGCNLNCSYCDTLFCKGFDYGKEITTLELLLLAKNSNCNLVEITGGEPLASKETIELCELLLKNDFEVLIETNGSMPIENVPKEVRKILDCKLPSSNMSEYMLFENYKYLQKHDEVKFVVGSLEDFNYAEEIIEKYSLLEKTSNLLFSPVWGKVSFEELAQWVINSKSGGRMQIQMHKIIWGERQGV